VIVAVLDLGNVANGLAAANIAVSRALVVPRLAQQQHRFLGMPEPFVGVETLFRREATGVLEMPVGSTRALEVVLGERGNENPQTSPLQDLAKVASGDVGVGRFLDFGSAGENERQGREQRGRDSLAAGVDETFHRARLVSTPPWKATRDVTGDGPFLQAGAIT
jgi:hypothetical protein